MRPLATRTRWWGGRAHIVYTVVVFIILASLDNAAIAVIPGMINPLEESLGTSDLALGAITGMTILVTALSSVPWGYLGDRFDRKSLLFWGTLIWATGSLLSSMATGFQELFWWQMFTALGLGAVASVGFAVVSDLVRPERRGLALSFWGISQGIGTVIGGLMSSQLGAANPDVPFRVIAIAGFITAGLYLLTFDVPRGYREPTLEGEDYGYRIEPEQLPVLWQRRTNRWVVLQGLFAQFAYGSLIWVPLLYQEKILAQGYSTATANRVGGIFATLIALGALMSIIGGYIGDRWQARSKSGRATLSAIGILGAIPFFLVFFFVPMTGITVTEDAGTLTLVGEIVGEIFTNPWVAVAFISGGLAVALTSADSPNALALVADVNLPEHRGTVFGAANLANGIGRSAGNGLTTAVAVGLERALPPPANYAVGLATFQLFFLPTGYCYLRAAKTSPADIDAVNAELIARGHEPTGATSVGNVGDKRPGEGSP
jgi:MFS family permease